jgi:hypothetical protein
VVKVRAAGYPTKAWLVTGQTNGIGYQTQELVPGREVGVIGVAEAAELIKVLELQAGLDPDPDRCWSDFLAGELKTGLEALRAGAARAGCPTGLLRLGGYGSGSVHLQPFTAPDARPAADRIMALTDRVKTN